MSRLVKITSSAVIGVALGLALGTSIASADAIFDKKNRGYFVTESGSDLTIGTAGSDTFNLLGASTPVAQINSSGITFQSGKGVALAVNVPTMAATAVAGTNDIKKGFNAIPTAAASTVGCLPAVPAAGDVFEGINTGPNAVRVKACGTPGINGGAAGTYFPVATQAYFKCVASTATAYQCGTLVIPTPAGP